MAGNESTSEFDDFMASGEVEVGTGAAPEKVDPKPKAEAEKPEPEPEAAEEETAEEGETSDESDEAADDGDDDESDDKAKKTRKPSDRIRELTRKLRDRDRLLEATLSRLENIEKTLPTANQGVTQSAELPEPDPSDAEKYPLGHLDDRYIEDKLDWLAEKKAAERADAVLQRQQEQEHLQAAAKQQEELLDKVDHLAARGSDLFEDFQESVVEAGMKGEWDLSQATFEAAHEAENGAQILYELSQDKAEASRVAKLSPYQQLKFVQARDAELSRGQQPRRIPKAGDPPKNIARGANSRTHISPATDNLDDFEKAWAQDAKKGF